MKALFGRAPRAAPAGALPNGENCSGPACGAGAGAPSGFQRGGGATFSWLRAAPPPLSRDAPPPATQRTKKTPSLSLQASCETGGGANPLRRAAAAARREGRGSEIDRSTPVVAAHGRCDPSATGPCPVGRRGRRCLAAAAGKGGGEEVAARRRCGWRWPEAATGRGGREEMAAGRRCRKEMTGGGRGLERRGGGGCGRR